MILDRHHLAPLWALRAEGFLHRHLALITLPEIHALSLGTSCSYLCFILISFYRSFPGNYLGLVSNVFHSFHLRGSQMTPCRIYLKDYLTYLYTTTQLLWWLALSIAIPNTWTFVASVPLGSSPLRNATILEFLRRIHRSSWMHGTGCAVFLSSP